MNLQAIDLGLIDFQKAHTKQIELIENIYKTRKSDYLIFCEHPAVITLGRRTNAENLLKNESFLKEKSIPVIKTNRGGDITCHSPGQMVIYPLIDLKKTFKDLHRYFRFLETVVIDALAKIDITAQRKEGLTGVWVKEKKIASIGIGVRRWISFHGMAINLNNSLEVFSFMKPCGLDVEMISAKKILSQDIDRDNFKHIIIEQFKKI
ncbi:MAG: lipoyl(octanoyl) transferase LipB [Candidatus Gygaella obscura]|nr:lipoyl(octanoyl) transferase LipB [Candidatus Gygaella obscura]